MEGKTLKYQDFTIYPECCGHSIKDLLEASKENDSYHIAAIPEYSQILAVVFHKGEVMYTRAKHRLHPSETQVKEGSEKPTIATLNGKRILILICYEIMFPEDYLQKKPPIDLVIHMVGYPMRDENQREGWIALQKCLALTYNCPVVCCCGGERTPMNITGVTML